MGLLRVCCMILAVQASFRLSCGNWGAHNKAASRYVKIILFRFPIEQADLL
jgi:hypothetical protein